MTSTPAHNNQLLAAANAVNAASAAAQPTPNPSSAIPLSTQQQHIQHQQQQQQQAASNPVYCAVYSGVPVFEMNCRSVAVMRRREDSFLNATQILKVAGVDKGRRTKILEREVQIGEHEKVQGGYGKYQGTWIPFERGLEIARQYGVDGLLRPLLEYVPGPNDELETPKKKRPQPKPSRAAREAAQGNDFDEIPRLAGGNGRNGGAASGSAAASGYMNQQASVPAQHRPPANNGERYRAILMSVFLNHENHKVPDLLTNPNPPADLDIDLIIDDQGHTSLHWASALARINILQLLLKLGADPKRVNYNGESALIRAVLVTNNFDNDSFYNLLALLHSSIDITDKKGRTVFHHITLTAGIKGRIQASRYYLDVLLDMMTRNSMDIGAIIDRQDKNGDTALNLACRVNNYAMVEQLLRAGANPEIPNRAGLRALDFGLEDQHLAELFQAQKSGEWPARSNAMDQKPLNPENIQVFGLEHSAAYNRYSYSARGKEMVGEFEGVVSHLEAEINRKDSQLQEAIAQIKNISTELSVSRRVIQQLSGRVAELQSQMHGNIPNSSGVAGVDVVSDPNGEKESIHRLESEIVKLRAIISANGLSEEVSGDGAVVATNMPADDEVMTRAHQLIAKILNVSPAQLTGPGSLINPLMNAVIAENQDLTNMDRDISQLLGGSAGEESTAALNADTMVETNQKKQMEDSSNIMEGIEE